MNVLSKNWDVSLSAPANGTPSYKFENIEAAYALDVSPVELLLGAISSCFAMSCQASLQARSKPNSEVCVRALGKKAEDKPNRLASAHLIVAFVPDIDPALRDKVVKDAKALCTVTNSLSDQLDLVIETVNYDEQPPSIS